MADKDLTKVLGLFVEKVTTEVIKDLLNELLKKKVLNERERESVLEGNNTRADRATCLIDMVRKKGPAASKTMIDYLKINDHNLHSILFPSSEQPAQTDASALPESEQNLPHSQYMEVEKMKKDGDHS